MHFNLSEEQQMVLDTINRFVEKEYSHADRSEIIRKRCSSYPAHWQFFAETGVLGLIISEENGGIGGNLTDGIVVGEALGRGLVIEPYISTAVVAVSILEKSAQPISKELLSDICEGSLQVAIAALEPSARFDLWQIDTSAKRLNEKWLLNGRKSVVLHASTADWLIVSARTSGDVCDKSGASLFLVPTNAAGVHIENYPGMDGHASSEITLKNVEIDDQHVLIEDDLGYQTIEWAIDRGIVVLCGEAVGAIDKLCEMTEEYVMTRKQFGQEIGRFQSIQHHIANMRIYADQVRSCAILAAANIDDQDVAHRRRSISTAKYLVGNACHFVGETALQLHGGIGMTAELAVGDFLKRLTCIDMTWGDSTHHLELFNEVMES